MKKILALLLTLTLLISLLAACGKDGDDKAKGAEGDDDVIKFGSFGPLSGDNAFYGLAVKNGAQLAIDEINEAGGIDGKTIQLVTYDSEGDPTKALQLFNRLVDQDGIKALLGGTFSGESITVGPEANKKQLPMLTPTATNSDVTPGLEYVYRACFIDPYQGGVAAKFASENLGATKAVIFRNTAEDYSVGLADNFVKSFPGEVVGDESYTAEEQDFKAIITKIKGLEPDVIFIPDYSKMVGLIATQIREAGIDVPLLGGDGWDGVQVDYAEVVEGNYFTNHYSTDDPTPAVQDFIAKYTETYGEVPNALAALSYDAAYIMAAAFDAADSTDGPDVIAELAKTEYTGVTGYTTFDADGNTAGKEAVIIKIVNGELNMETKMSE